MSTKIVFTEEEKKAIEKVLEERKPLPPEILASALQDRIHNEPLKSRPAKSFKVYLEKNKPE